MTNKFQEQRKRAKERLDALPSHARLVVTRPLVSSAATIPRVPRPRGELSPARMKRIATAATKRDEAEATYRDEVLAALTYDGASFSEVSKATGLSTNTLQRWKREAKS